MQNNNYVLATSTGRERENFITLEEFQITDVYNTKDDF